MGDRRVVVFSRREAAFSLFFEKENNQLKKKEVTKLQNLEKKKSPHGKLAKTVLFCGVLQRLYKSHI
jgi:hypothetical protein